MMPLGYGRNVDTEHHLSANSEWGLWDILVSLGLLIITMKERKSLAFIHNLISFYKQSTVYLLYLNKIKSIWHKNKTYGIIMRQMGVSQINFCFRVDSKPLSGGMETRTRNQRVWSSITFPFSGNKMPTNSLMENINNA